MPNNIERLGNPYWGIRPFKLVDVQIPKMNNVFSGKIETDFSNKLKKSDSLNNKFDISSFLKNGEGSINGGIVSDVTNVGLNVAKTGLEAAGIKQAELSGGEQVASSIMNVGGDLLLKSGNPYGMAAGAVLKGLDFVNTTFGKTSDKQHTQDMDIAGYSRNINNNADRKYSVFSTWLGKPKKTNKLTANYEYLNAFAAANTYNQKQNYKQINNTASYLKNKNAIQLYGGNNTRMLAAKKGTKINPAYFRNIINYYEVHVQKMLLGGLFKSSSSQPQTTTTLTVSQTSQKSSPMAYAGTAKIEYEVEDKSKDLQTFKNNKTIENSNVIPEGAFHSRKHSLPDDISKDVTNKGIPVISKENGNVQQHAEIEKNEIIFRKEATDKLEGLFNKYNKATGKEKDLIAIECGKFITNEILINTIDNTGLIKEI